MVGDVERNEFDEKARATLRHKGPCTCFRGEFPVNHCPDGLCGDAVDRIATALRAERDEAEAALTRYGDDGAYHALRDTNAALEKTREALERIQQWIQAWDVPREDGRLTEDEIMEVIAEALTDATPPSQPVEPRSPHKPR